MPIKDVIRNLLPRSALRSIRAYKVKRVAREFQHLTTAQVFSKIYQERTWGYSDKAPEEFFSGSGSHESEIVSAYVTALRPFLSSFPQKPDVVDLGCGDFHIGSNIREFCRNYIACDIVPNLIEFNKKKYRHLDVDFRVLDLAEDELPAGDIVFIRQVLQHLSNEHIQKALPKIIGAYKFLVLTEHLPDADTFVPNLDKAAGPGIRVASDSGIVLTRAPFNLKVKTEKMLCEVREYGPYGGRIRTILYELA